MLHNRKAALILTLLSTQGKPLQWSPPQDMNAWVNAVVNKTQASAQAQEVDSEEQTQTSGEASTTSELEAQEETKPREETREERKKRKRREREEAARQLLEGLFR